MARDQSGKIIATKGGTINASVVAAGYHATATKVVNEAGPALHEKGLADVKAQLDVLMAALNQHGDKLRDPAPSFELVERVAGELGKKAPDKLTLKGFLNMLVEETRPVAELARAVVTFKSLVAPLL